MKKKVYSIILLSLIIFIVYEILTPPRVTSEGYFIASKERRMNIIKNLREGNCWSGDTISLIITYKKVYNDINASQCWANYRQECSRRNEEHKSLKIPINCPTY